MEGLSYIPSFLQISEICRNASSYSRSLTLLLDNFLLGKSNHYQIDAPSKSLIVKIDTK